MVNRIRFIYRPKDIASYVVRCLCLRKKKLSESKREVFFKKGEHKLLSELDVTTLLRSMRKIKLLT